MLHTDEIDCKFPSDIDEVEDRSDQRAYSCKQIRSISLSNTSGSILTINLVSRWKVEYAAKVISKVARKLSVTGPMRYSDILELDQQVRGYPSQTDSPNLDGCYAKSSFHRLMRLLHTEGGAPLQHILTRIHSPITSAFCGSP